MIGAELLRGVPPGGRGVSQMGSIGPKCNDRQSNILALGPHDMGNATTGWRRNVIDLLMVTADAATCHRQPSPPA